jgi:hypothetical protein
MNSKPKFDFTSFRVAMLNQGIQLTDADIFSTFQTYKARALR